jgi:translation initiation factor IF-3
MQARHLINEQIRVPLVRVVTQHGELLGVCTVEEGIALARRSGMDLVEVAPDARPPICRIMDYGKFVYEQKKKRRAWPRPPPVGGLINGTD